MLFPGDWVEVLSAREILSTLDPQQALENLPFMLEMLPFCGRVFQVQIRADRTCVRALPPGESEPIRELNDSVVLADLRCDGSAHGGCQLGCMFFWKERWLKKFDGHRKEPDPLQVDLRSSLDPDPARYFCQGTNLGRATRGGHSKWNPQEYARLLRMGTLTGSELIRMFGLAALRRLKKALHSLLPARLPEPDQAGGGLDLQPGEWVEVKSMGEILETLDGWWSHQGLTFSSDMCGFCGKKMQVQSRIRTILDEGTGRIRTVRNTVSLVGTDCRKYMGCARQMPLLWRETWLKRTPSPFP